MKHLFRSMVALFAAVAVGGSAFGQECVPLAPKDVTSPVVFAHPGQSIAVAMFEEGGCTWPVPQLNGTDGAALDVAGMEGATGNVIATLPEGQSLTYEVMNAYFLDAACAKIGGTDITVATSPSEAPEATSLTIPPNAKWFVVGATVGGSTNNVSITLHSDGKDCEVALPKKKKKKKRR